MINYWEIYQKEKHTINIILISSLIFLNIMDLGLTYIGVGHYGYGEANCHFEESVEDNNYVPITTYKALMLIGLAGFTISARRLDTVKFRNESLKRLGEWGLMQSVITVGLLFMVGIYLYVVINWLFLIALAFFGFY